MSNPVSNYKIPIVLAPQRGAAYQPRVQPRGKDPRIMIFGQASVIRQYAAFLQNARIWQNARILGALYPGFPPGLVCALRGKKTNEFDQTRFNGATFIRTWRAGFCSSLSLRRPLSSLRWLHNQKSGSPNSFTADRGKDGRQADGRQAKKER